MIKAFSLYMLKLIVMHDEEREKIRIRVNNRKKTGVFLEKLRREEIRNSNLAETILSLNDASESALIMCPAKPASGLIEMQKLFAKLKK